jgi:PAS domain S-box-containing protein
MDVLFTDLFDAVPDALIVVDDMGRIVMANRQAERMFDHPRDGLAGTEIEMLLPEEARGRHRAHRAGYMAQPHIRPMGATGQTLVGLRRDGTRFPVEIALSPIAGRAGPRYLASIRDISETQRAKEALVRAGYDTVVARIGQLALEADDEEDVLEQVPGMLADALRIETVVIAAARPAARWAQLRASTGLAASHDRLDANALAAVLSHGGTVVVDDFADPSTDPFPLPHAGIGSGVVVPLLDRNRAAGALIASSRQPRRFDHDALHLLQSVANLLAALAQRRHSEEQLAHAQRLDALGQLTGGIAHDFNNLLTVMSGSLQLLELETEERAEARELIASALRSVARGAELTAKLLAFARRQRLLPQATNPQQLLQDVELMLRRTLGDTVRLRVDSEPDLPAAFIDPTQLEAALVNLALNARDAMPEGGEIDVSARQVVIDAERSSEDLPVGDYVLVAVSDTGHGMSPEVLARAVEPFFTTKESGRGSGLGLSMVYGFAKQSGGHLQIDSRPGRGTRVELYLPATRAVPEAFQQAAGGSEVGGGENILVVEDDAAVRGIAVAFLRSAAYRVMAVASAGDARQVLLDTPDVALLFSDVVLGSGGNGKELAMEARRLRPSLPILLTSGYEEHASPDSTEFEMLRKPYRREQLLAAVQRLLETPVSARTGDR